MSPTATLQTPPSSEEYRTEDRYPYVPIEPIPTAGLDIKSATLCNRINRCIVGAKECAALDDAAKAADFYRDALSPFQQLVVDLGHTCFQADLVNVSFNAGVAAQLAGRLEDATKQYTKAIGLAVEFGGEQRDAGHGKLNATLAASYFNCGLLQTQLGKLDDAIAHHDAALRIGGRDRAKILDALGHARCLKGQFNEAIADLTKAIKAKPKNASYYHNRGSARTKIGQYEEAIADFSEAIRLEPMEPAGYYCRARALVEVERHDEALDDFSQLIRLEPDDLDNIVARASIAASLGRHDLAIADFTKLIEFEPTDFSTYLSRAASYCATSNFQATVADLCKAAKLLADNSDRQRFIQLLASNRFADLPRGLTSPLPPRDNLTELIEPPTTRREVEPEQKKQQPSSASMGITSHGNVALSQVTISPIIDISDAVGSEATTKQRQALQVIFGRIIPTSEELAVLTACIAGLELSNHTWKQDLIERLKCLAPLARARFTLNGSPVTSMSTSYNGRGTGTFDIRPENGDAYQRAPVPFLGIESISTDSSPDVRIRGK